MTVREFAERVLFGTTLEEKLVPPPSGIVDVARGKALVTPEAPGRPTGLRLRSDGVRAEFPGTAGIEDDAQRGRLLHFFANHELLATELMALVLLKFPEAPDEFRTGILQTLREEQMHTKLYLKRMAECGVAFGDLPVNGFFWKAVAPMPTPLDYVTRLSLTFEQANLDYSRGYAKVFAEAGDEETAAVLDRIYRDEIRHVHYGLEWFRRWKERKGESDWKAFTSRLERPLSAARAKGGFLFNEEGRREAGLDEEFIRELRVYAQSKGRTPNVFWFNPGAEESLVSPGTGGATPAALRVGRDLAVLPAYLARREDVVLVPEVPPTDFLTGLLKAGIEMPEFVAAGSVAQLAERKLHELRPWARTPDALRLMERLGVPCELTAPEMFSKAVHAEFLGKLVRTADCPILCAPEAVGTVVVSRGEVQGWLDTARAPACVFKAPFSTAGRGRVIRKTEEVLSAKELAFIETTLREQGALVIEPWLERIIDFSIQFDYGAESGLRRRGLVVLENTERGQFRRATVADRFTDFLDDEARRALFADAPKRGFLAELIEDRLEPELTALLAEHGYAGPLGVDAFLYRDGEGEVRIKPVVEINPRYTMGRVAIELARFTPANAITQLVIEKATALPLEGALRLTPGDPEARFAAYLSPGPGN